MKDIQRQKHTSQQRHFKNQYFKLGNGMQGELLPLAGPIHKIDHTNSFYVVPNITYESLLADPVSR